MGETSQSNQRRNTEKSYYIYSTLTKKDGFKQGVYTRVRAQTRQDARAEARARHSLNPYVKSVKVGAVREE